MRVLVRQSIVGCQLKLCLGMLALLEETAACKRPVSAIVKQGGNVAGANRTITHVLDVEGDLTASSLRVIGACAP